MLKKEPLMSGHFLLVSALLFLTSPYAFQDTLTRIESITFEGNLSISASQLKMIMRRCPEGKEYDPGALASDLIQVEKTYRDAGFLHVQLEMPGVRIQPSGEGKTAAIRIVVKEGPRYTTGKVSVRNASAIAMETLMQICPLQKSQPYSPDKASQWQAKVEDSFRALGYMKAQCPVRESINESSRVVDCSMECVEGKIYTVGKINIDGGAAVNPLELKKRLFFSEGGIFNPEMLSLTIQYLNQSRKYEPLSGSDVEMKFDDENGIVDVSLRVVPHAQ
jgi:outer membrane protein assembly factor BamA